MRPLPPRRQRIARGQAPPPAKAKALVQQPELPATRESAGPRGISERSLLQVLLAPVLGR